MLLQRTVSENSTMAYLENFLKGIFVDKKKENKEAEKYVESLAIKTPSVKQLVVDLSGGNQQKVVLAKWLVRNCDILIFDEPTRGIDVGAKSDIYKLMNELVKEGKSIIMISSELPEVLRMSDRIVVMCEGSKSVNSQLMRQPRGSCIWHAELEKWTCQKKFKDIIVSNKSNFSGLETEL